MFSFLLIPLPLYFVSFPFFLPVSFSFRFASIFVKFLFPSCSLLFPAPVPSLSVLFLPFMSVLVPFRSVRCRSIFVPFTFYFGPDFSVSFISIFNPVPFRSFPFSPRVRFVPVRFVRF